MKRTIGLFALALLLALGAAAWAAADKATPPKSSDRKDAVQACTGMMQGPDVTEQDEKAMQDFMQSDRAPQTMTKMMEMARRMGDGDVMLGMTRMMEMMSGQGGMMGGRGGMMDGHGGVMLPPGAEPGK
jgi:hypothetical protein